MSSTLLSPRDSKPSSAYVDTEDMKKITAWQSDMDVLEQSQMKIQADQMSLVHSQIHILMRELGDLQKGIVTLTEKVDDVTCLRDDLRAAQETAHAALRLELAEHGGKADEIKAAMEEASQAMRSEWKLSHRSLKDDLDAHRESTRAMDQMHHAKHAQNAGKLEAAMEEANQAMRSEWKLSHRSLKDDLDSHRQSTREMDEMHHEKHAQNAEKLEAKLDSVLGGAHVKLQEDLQSLRSGGAGSLKDLSRILFDVTQQVDTIDQAVKKEHELRMAVEGKLDQMFNEQNSNVKDLRKDLQVALKESHAALKLELAEHGQSKEKLKAAMEEAHLSLMEEVKLSHSSLKAGLESHIWNNDAKHKLNEQAMHTMNQEHHEKHAQNAQKLENSITNVLGGAHAKLQEELRLLKAGGAGSLTDLSRIVTEVTAQVDKIDQSVEKEHQLRMAVERKLDKMFNDQDKVIQHLRNELAVLLNESHGALRFELAEHGKNKDELKAAMLEAHVALKQEMDVHKQNLEIHGKMSKACISDLETQLRRDLSNRELHNAIQEHISKMEFSHSSMEERQGYLERQLKERYDAQNTLAGQFRGESVTREQNMNALESKIMMMEARLIEVNDRNAKDMEGAHSKLREDLKQIEQHRSLNDNHMIMIDQRLSSIEQHRSSNDNQIAMIEQRVAHVDSAILEVSDTHSKSLSFFQSEFGKEMKHLLHTERMAREQQEKTFFDFIQDARQQKESLELTVAEQLRLERVAREVQAQQMRDALTQQVLWQGNKEYTEMLVQERSDREAIERALERRIEAFERAVSNEQNERAQDIHRIWNAFDSHTHESMSAPIMKMQLPVPPRNIVSPRSMTTTTSAAQVLSPRYKASTRSESDESERVPALSDAYATPITIKTPMTVMSPPVVSSVPRRLR